MFVDSRLEFASAASVAAAAGTALIGSQIDTGAAANVGDVDDLFLVIIATTGIITGGSAGTVRFQLASGTTAAIPTNGTANVHAQTGDFVTGASTLPAGTVLATMPLPKGNGVTPAYARYLGILCVTGTTTTTAGAIEAFLTTDVGFWAPKAIASN